MACYSPKIIPVRLSFSSCYYVDAELCKLRELTCAPCTLWFGNVTVGHTKTLPISLTNTEPGKVAVSKWLRMLPHSASAP